MLAEVKSPVASVRVGGCAFSCYVTSSHHSVSNLIRNNIDYLNFNFFLQIKNIKMNRNIAVFVVVLASCAYLGSALECYDCTELSDTHCKDPFNGTAGKKQCMGQDVCLKQSTPEIKIGNNVIAPVVTRGCGDKSLCDSALKELSGYCGYCTSNLCNSAVAIVPSFTVITLYIVKCIFL